MLAFILSNGYICTQQKGIWLMRNIYLTFIVSAVALVDCTAPSGEAVSAEEAKARKKLEMAENVKNDVTDRHFSIDVRQMYPQSAPAQALSSSFSLELRGDTLLSNLPYFGRAYQLPYGGGDGLHFTGVVFDYNLKRIKDYWRTTFSVRNEGDTYVYTVDVYDNSAATIGVSSNNREHISFSGLKD